MAYFVFHQCPKAILKINEARKTLISLNSVPLLVHALSKCYHLDVVRGPSTPHDPESNAGGSLNSWQSHPSR
jgi:hypothetical protein